MPKTIEARTYEEALAWLRDHGFDITDAPGTNGRVFLRKYNVSAAIQKTPDDAVKIFAYPGYLIGSEISKLVNRGYQQFLKTSKNETPATADDDSQIKSKVEGKQQEQHIERIEDAGLQRGKKGLTGKRIGVPEG